MVDGYKQKYNKRELLFRTGSRPKARDRFSFPPFAPKLIGTKVIFKIQGEGFNPPCLQTLNKNATEKLIKILIQNL